MSGIFWLDALALAVSLFNCMLLFWLGMIVWLTSERRSWGILLTSIGLMLGAFFFISHSIILAQSFDFQTHPLLDVWWHAGWYPVILSPFIWYLVVLWYAGYWEKDADTLRARQRPLLLVVALAAIALIGLMAFGSPLPSFSQITRLDLRHTPSIMGIPLIIAFFPLYILACLGLALDALLRPGPTRRLMGVQARTRARPWLIGSSFTLLFACLLVCWALAWVFINANNTYQIETFQHFARVLTRFDLSIALLIGTAVLMLGQALVSYEIFTGKSLPRKGLQRYYRNAVILSVGISVVVAAAFSLHISPIYSLLLALLIITGFYALLTWRSISERDWTIRQLRPFVSSPRLYDRMLAAQTANPAELDLQTPFSALCEDVLETRQAALIALGALAPLVSGPLLFPRAAEVEPPALTDLLPRLKTAEQMALSLYPEEMQGYHLVVPLWSERGLIGALLLGEKKGGGFYNLEEIEIARTSGERLVDTLASAEIARRLAALQRERMVASQLLDRQTRRVLHDEILPALHASLLNLSASPAAQEPQTADAVRQLSGIHRQISELLRSLPPASPPEIARLGILVALKQVIERELAGAFDSVIWEQDESAESAAQTLPALTTEVVYYAAREALRNAAHHARGSQPLRLSVRVSGSHGLRIVIEDDGVGFDPSQPAADIDSGHGLTLHTTLMAVAGGSLQVESKPGTYTRVLLEITPTLA